MTYDWKSAVDPVWVWIYIDDFSTGLTSGSAANGRATEAALPLNKVTEGLHRKLAAAAFHHRECGIRGM
jgi:hypothetical protein